MNLRVISKYRTQLMGIACLWIMFFHNRFQWTGTNLLRTFLKQGNVGVDIFMFLSGVGLYYSLQSGKNLGAFYWRRVIRLLIPYCLLAIPYYLWLIIIGKGKYSFIAYFLQVVFVRNGVVTTWFIPCILAFSILFPLIYHLQNGEVKIAGRVIHRNILTGVLCVLWLLMLLYIRAYHKILFKNTEIALTRGIAFIVGGHFGKYIKEERSMPTGTVFFSVVFILVYTLVFLKEVKLGVLWKRISYVPLSISWILTYSALLSWLKLHFDNWKMPILTFVGRRSLELYLLHIMIRKLYAFYFGFPYLTANGVIDYLIVIAVSIIISVPIHALNERIIRCLAFPDKGKH